ncbi:ATP-binding protein [Streptomyces sp. N2-109]|uniref:ATP-binding protein n=1 Tax=Streptomyces gossypii TaxID=2883101 RepID=A0ABT2JUZ9_9ACTN|nr:ATP-binding protein [Streptomyces gossypii]MCT2591712.1 ATP-binding protein [Streptomyces gossypii]
MEIRGSLPPGAGGRAPVATPVQERARPLWYEGTWRFAAPPTDTSVPQLRHAVRDLVGRQRAPVPDELLQGLLLIVSELVTNSVRHAALLSPEIRMEVSLGATWVRVAVEDGHPYRPKALEADPDQEHTGGRGLLLVKTITQEAGGVCDVEQTGTGGKVIWAALPLALSGRPGGAPEL